tara:strand:- start:2702 stop:3166 length:465 start_codon:yes stop_codon:yes gene_type:complete
VVFLNKYISRLLIISLIIISFYNIFSIFVLSFSSKIEGYFIKSINYLPYNHSIFFQKPLKFSKNDFQSNNPNSAKLYYLISTTEKKSALDFTYWEKKVLYQISNKSISSDFEKDFINYAILSKNRVKKNKSIKLYYLRNVPRFSKEVKNILFPE